MSKTVTGTYGPRGEPPKYIIYSDGSTDVRYFGLLKDGKLPYDKKMLPDVLTGNDTYAGNSDWHRIDWVKKELKKLEYAAGLIVAEIKAHEAVDSDIRAVVGGSLAGLGIKLLAINPVAGGVVSVAGLIINRIGQKANKDLVTFKLGVIKGLSDDLLILQAEYSRLANELFSLRVKIWGLYIMIVSILYLLFRK